MYVNYNIYPAVNKFPFKLQSPNNIPGLWHLCGFVQLNSLVFLICNTDVMNTAENADTLNMLTSLTLGAVTIRAILKFKSQIKMDGRQH